MKLRVEDMFQRVTYLLQENTHKCSHSKTGQWIAMQAIAKNQPSTFLQICFNGEQRKIQKIIFPKYEIHSMESILLIKPGVERKKKTSNMASFLH